MNSLSFLAFAYSGYFFFCAIPHTPAARYTFLGLSLLVALWAIYQERASLKWRSPLLYAVSGFTVIAGLSAVISPYPTESLAAFRKEYLTPALLILLAGILPWSSQQSQRFITFLIGGIGIGFLVKAMLAFWDGAITHPWIFSPYSNPEFFEQNGLPKYVSYFAVDAGLYIPLVLGSVLFWLGRSKIGILLLTSVLLAYGIVLISGIRTAFFVATVGISLPVLIRYAKPRHIVYLAVVTVLVAVGIIEVAKTNLEVQRYVEIFKPESYSKEKGMSDRYPIWQATSEIVAQRPILGFGPGWQKIPTVAKETGLLDTWKGDASYYAQRKVFWFSLTPGKTNPHNLAMQLLFETGWIGLIGYIGLLVGFVISAWNLRKATDTHFRWIGITVPVFMICYLVLCVTNGFLFPPSLVVLMIAVLVASSAKNNVT